MVKNGRERSNMGVFQREQVYLLKKLSYQAEAFFTMFIEIDDMLENVET